MKGTYIGNRKMMIFPTWGGKLLVSSEDLSLMPELLQNGVIEAPLTNFLINHVKPSSTVIDAGANIGYFTVLLGYLVGPYGKVIAYEANPDIFPLLQDNLSINYLFDRVELNNKAVYSTYGDISFYRNDQFQGNSSIHPHNDFYCKHYPRDKSSKIQVEAEPLDIYINKYPKIDLVKIDIEGGEYHAFMGMENLFRNQKVDCIVFEFNREMLQQDAEPFFQLLKHYRSSVNAHFHSLSDKGELAPFDFDLFLRQSFPYVVCKLNS